MFDDVGWEVIKWLGSDKARENLIGKVLSTVYQEIKRDSTT